MKRALAMILVLMMAGTVFAASPFGINTVDLKLYDAKGNEMALTDEVAGTVGNGWIVRSADKEIVITTPDGNIVLSANTTLVTGNLEEKNPSLYLVDGEASFSVEPSIEGKLTVSTPVSRFQAGGGTEFMIRTTTAEESVAVFKGNVTAVNGLTHKKTVVESSFQYNLGLDESQELSLYDGKYKELAVDERQPVIVPETSSSTPIPTIQKATVKPYEGSEEKRIGQIPAKPQIIAVNQVPMEEITAGTPVAPTTLLVKDIEKQHQTTFIITVTPMKPKKPVFKPTKIRVMRITAPAQQEQPETTEAKPSKQVSTLTTSVAKPAKRIGFTASYEYDLYTDLSMYHTLAFKPFYTSELFSIRLNAYEGTADFKNFDGDLASFPHDTGIETAASIFRYFDSLSIGKKNGAFYFSIDKDFLHTEGTSLSSRHVVESNQKNAFVSIRLSSVTFRMSFQDLGFTNLLNGQYQYGNVSFTYAPDPKSLNMSLGALYRANATDKASTYPYFELNQPLVETRSFSMHFLFGFGTYLPIYPKVDLTSIYNDSASPKIQSYNVSGGLSFGSGSFSSKVIVLTHKGDCFPFVNSEFTENLVDTSYSSDMDIVGSLDWQDSLLNAHLLYSQPFSFSGSSVRSKLSADTSRGADFLEASLGLSLKAVNLRMGYAIYGIGETQGEDFYNGSYVALSGTLEYTYKDFTFSLGARKPADNTGKKLYGFLMCSYTLAKEL